MWNNKLCRRLFESRHDFAARTVLRASWATCGILTIILCMPKPAQAALAQWERIELGPKREPMNRERILGDGKLLSQGERERVLNKVQRRFNALQSEIEDLRPKARLLEPDKNWLIPPERRGLVTLHDLAPQRDSQEYVRWVRDSLNRAMGMQLTLDGINTPTAKEAIREFQGKYGLVADGIVGPKTESKLSEMTNTQPPGRWPLRPLVHWDVLKFLEERKPAEEASPQANQKRVFLDVRKNKGRFSVTARKDGDLWLEEAGLAEFANGTKQEVSSLAEFEKLLGDADTVVHQGDDLPKEWRDRLQQNHDYLRHSWRSRRLGLGEYVRAAELLDRRAEPGKTRIFSALPQAREEKALRRELKRMGLDTQELEGWQRLQQNIDGVKAESEFNIEAGTKDALLEELRKGTNDTIVISAHSEDGVLYFPGGETISIDELSAIHREIAPDRSVILSTCEGGKVNTPLQSFSEKLLAGNMGLNVIAHPNPISATDVPDILREFLIQRKSIKEVFVRRGYLPICENLEREQDAAEANLVADVVADERLVIPVSPMHVSPDAL